MNENNCPEDVHWAQLVCTTDVDTPPFLIGKDKFTIGRSPGCDISLKDNKLVSGHHCYILRDESGKVWLHDTSTNGTLFNSSIKLSKGKRQQIDHGDEFYIIYKKGEEELNVGYVYQDLQRLREEEKEEEVDTTLEYDSEALPLIDATIADESLNQVMDEELKALHGVKRKHPAELNLELVTKEARFQVESNPVTTQEGCQGLEAAKRNSLTKQTSCQPSEAAESDPLSTTVIITTTTTATTTTPCSTSFSTNITERAAAVDIAEGKQISINSPPQDLVPSISAKTPQNVEEEDSFASTLTCIICQELLHDCISLQPCMHSFCAGCYSEWMSQSKECPSCRTRVERINKNHIVNNLIDAYLKEHPDKQRSEEDIKTLNAKNKITHDMLYPRQRSSSSDYSESDNEDQDQLLAPWIAPVTGSVFGFGTPYFGVTNLAYRARCRQCPGASNNSTASINSPVAGVAGGSCASATSNTEQPSVSGVTTTDGSLTVDRDAKIMPVPPDYHCAANQNHVLCQCCLQIFPDRRAERDFNSDIPPQQCTVCFRAFCHAYWGCRKLDCNGCLAKFKDLNFGKKVLTGLILDNPYESQVFQNYLQTKGLAVRDVLETCITKWRLAHTVVPTKASTI
ncbi:E3 ubiquitin-protein ligase CHFR-like [Pomacea canaliculata]|uniref:E3 ubiquitin-protein ligase CHFR-like n=1 Tax=Pomacea canaliculata TaxID=400727 RepID=UPI000D725CDC|nr:E3 ubiquitin-protein ligase CHFR-like [Pomacea canaliculata]